MPRVPSLTPRQLQRVLVAEGFEFVGSKGSHAYFVRGRAVVTVPMHSRELPRGLLLAIIKQSGIPQERFLGGRRS